MVKLIWLVEHPLYQYKEDVKELAAKGMLQIVDVNFAKNFTEKQLVKAADAPKLTKKAKAK